MHRKRKKRKTFDINKMKEHIKTKYKNETWEDFVSRILNVETPSGKLLGWIRKLASRCNKVITSYSSWSLSDNNILKRICVTQKTLSCKEVFVNRWLWISKAPCTQKMSSSYKDTFFWDNLQWYLLYFRDMAVYPSLSW